jgi:hypothetical protein
MVGCPIERFGHPVHRWRILALPHAAARTVRRCGTLLGPGTGRLNPYRLLQLRIYTADIIYS